MSSIDNPYAPPETKLKEVGETVIYPTAGAGLRFANYFLDQLCVLCGSYLAGFAMAAGAAANAMGASDRIEQSNAVMEGLIGYPVMMVYYTLFEGIFGRTPGKWATGTRAVMKDGSRLKVSAAFLRTLCRLIPFEAFSFLANDSRGWHDRITGTAVVNLRGTPRHRRHRTHSARSLTPQPPEPSPAGKVTLPPPRHPSPMSPMQGKDSRRS